jgi:hypothetical protein
MASSAQLGSFRYHNEQSRAKILAR